MFIRVPQFDFDIDAFEIPLLPSLRLQSNTIKLDLKLGCFFGDIVKNKLPTQLHLETTHFNDMLNLNFHSWALSEYCILKENRRKFFRKYQCHGTSDVYLC